MALSLMIPMDRELAEQRHRHRVRFVALLRLGQESSLDLASAQWDIANEIGWDGDANDVGAGDARSMVGPRVAVKPMVHRLSAAIKSAAIVGLGERTGCGYFCCHVGVLRARSLSPAISCGGRLAQASNASQLLAGMVTTRRSRTSASAASSAL